MNLDKIKTCDDYSKLDASVKNSLEALFTVESKSLEYLKVNHQGELEKKVASCAFLRFFLIHWHARSVNAAVNELYGRVALMEGHGDHRNPLFFDLKRLFYHAFGKDFYRKTGIELTPEMTTQEVSAYNYWEFFEKLILIASKTSKNHQVLRSIESTSLPTISDLATFKDYSDMVKILNTCDLPFNKVEMTLRKVKKINEALSNNEALENQDKLTIEDLSTIQGAFYLFVRFNIEPTNTNNPFLDSLFEIKQLCSGNSGIGSLLLDSQKPGDIAFDDSHIEHLTVKTIDLPLMDIIFNSMMHHLYQRNSHSCVCGDKQTLHLRNRVKASSLTKDPLKMTYLKVLSPDFGKIFTEFSSLSPDDQTQVENLYRFHISESIKQEEASKDSKYKKIHNNSVEVSTYFKLLFMKDKCVTQPKPLPVEGGLSCSGFTAGFVFEALQWTRNEWNKAHPQQQIGFQPDIVKEVTNMTPKLLKNWGIWKENREVEENLSKILASEVLTLRAQS